MLIVSISNATTKKEVNHYPYQRKLLPHYEPENITLLELCSILQLSFY